MPGKQRVAPPIDRPLSKAYMRQFTGWSTAYPPGLSEPTSCRVMENMYVDRNGALAVRPGLRYLSYKEAPDMDPLVENAPGVAIDRPLVGTQEPFYLIDGSKALLMGVREEDGTVGFRCIRFAGSTTVVHSLTDTEIGFQIPQGEEVLNFTEGTTHIEYLQINNRIIALSDNGESIRMFFVGGAKVAKKLNTISVPEWEDSHKLTVVHPAATWIRKQQNSSRRNELLNPSFEIGGAHWTRGSTTSWTTLTENAPKSGTRYLRLTSMPSRTNLQTSPLHDVSTTGTAGWYPHQEWGKPTLSKDGDWMKVNDSKGEGLFLAYGARLSNGVKAGETYQLAFDYSAGAHVEVRAYLTFYSASGAKIGESTRFIPKSSRYASGGVKAPTGATSMRVSLGGNNEEKTSTFVKFKNVVLCREAEATSMFHGGSGTDYSWTGTANASTSIYHPPQTVMITSARVPIKPSASNTVSAYVRGSTSNWTIKMRTFDKDGGLVSEHSASDAVAVAWANAEVGAVVSAAAVRAELQLSVSGVGRGESVDVDAAMLVPGQSDTGNYFDGSTAPTSLTQNSWVGTAHASASIQAIYTDLNALPTAQTPSANSLISSDATKNTYKMALFYVFENEVGESAASKMTEVRMMRPWSNWRWEKPADTGEPNGQSETVAGMCADQLVASVPQAVYDRALSEGAIKWTLYGITWSDQEAVPPIANIISERELYSDPAAINSPAIALPYADGGWIAVTPSRKVGTVEAFLPTKDNRVNHSVPSRARNGLVAGDRLILVGDPTELSTIRWSSNKPGEYTNFTTTKGGGAKTLTTGNLHLPAAVVLWQNPQSVDTLTVLCTRSDGPSASFYMAPASINAQSGSTSVMGFEETTSTPGSMSSYGAEVMNNSLFRPLDRALLKSTAANYNINHKTMSDKIANVWQGLLSKEWVMSTQLDNRLFYLVHNPQGALLEQGCKGNEIWVFDGAAESGNWSRFLIQGAALRPFNVGSQTYVGVTRPEGLYYLDSAARQDDYVTEGGTVQQRPIPWRFETNTQGANRAHDAWAHLQQVGIMLGSFRGTMTYGVRGLDLNGMRVSVSKRFTDEHPLPDDGMPWDVEDYLLIRRDMKEWFFHAESVPDMEGHGTFGYIQYRYTPVTVNVGYEFGSVETFEYGTPPAGYAENGIPLTYMDYSRP